MKDAIDHIVIRRSIRQWQCAQSIVKADTHSVFSGRNVFGISTVLCALQSLSRDTKRLLETCHQMDAYQSGL